MTHPGPEPGGSDARETRTPLAGIRLLLVEDDRLLRIALGGLLSAAGAAVLAAEDVEAAVALLAEQGAVDVVLTDLQLPGPSGIWLAEWCMGNLPGVPVVLMSAAIPPSGTIFPPSVRRFMGKPFDPDALIAAIVNALRP